MQIRALVSCRHLRIYWIAVCLSASLVLFNLKSLVRSMRLFALKLVRWQFRRWGRVGRCLHWSHRTFSHLFRNLPKNCTALKVSSLCLREGRAVYRQLFTLDSSLRVGAAFSHPRKTFRVSLASVTCRPQERRRKRLWYRGAGQTNKTLFTFCRKYANASNNIGVKVYLFVNDVVLRFNVWLGF